MRKFLTCKPTSFPSLTTKSFSSSILHVFKSWSPRQIENNLPLNGILTPTPTLTFDSTSFQELNNKRILKLSLDNKPIIVSGQELNNSEIVYSWVNEVIRGKERYVTFKKIGKSKLKRPELF